MSSLVHPPDHERVPESRLRLPGWLRGMVGKRPRAPRVARRPSVGIALSSGGAKGLAHVGVIQVLEEHGVDVDVVAGTSMGAYVGALWASGLDGGQLEGLAAVVERKRDLLGLIDPVLPPRRGFIRGRKIRRRLQRSLGDKRFSELPRRLLVVATDAGDFSRRVLDRGEVVSAVMASLAIPGIIVPVRRGGVDYVDGGVSEPLPVRVLEERAAPDLTIAVDVLPALAELHTGDGGAPGRRDRTAWRRGLGFLNRHLNYFARGNLLDILRRSAMGAQIRIVEHSASMADVLIRPTAPSLRWHDYTNWAAYIESGRRAALEAMPEIEARLARFASPTPSHEPPTLPDPCT